MYEPDYCSLLLLLCERKFATFSKHNIRYEYDVFSRSRQFLILLYWLNIVAVCLDTWKPRSEFKIRYPAVWNYHKFQHRKIHSVLPTCRIIDLFRNVKQFQVLFWLVIEEIFESSWTYGKILMSRHLPYSDSQRLKCKQITIEPPRILEICF